MTPPILVEMCKFNVHCHSEEEPPLGYWTGGQEWFPAMVPIKSLRLTTLCYLNSRLHRGCVKCWPLGWALVMWCANTKLNQGVYCQYRYNTNTLSNAANSHTLTPSVPGQCLPAPKDSVIEVGFALAAPFLSSLPLLNHIPYCDLISDASGLWCRRSPPTRTTYSTAAIKVGSLSVTPAFIEPWFTDETGGGSHFIDQVLLIA